jgi:hypothetical protein
MDNELTLLKERATAMGISYSPNIGVVALRAKVDEKLNGTKDDAEAEGALDEQDSPEVDPAPDAKPAKVLTKSEQVMVERMKQRKEQLRLVRVRITNLNPAKKDLRGEIFTVANAYVGTQRKYIPYGEESDVGYHMPFIIYNELKDRKFVSIKTRKGPNGQQIVDQRIVSEFAVELLEPLTEAELAKLASAQAAAAGTD